MLATVLLLTYFGGVIGQVLVPPYTNLALGKKISATATCGELNGEPIKEMFCQIAGSGQYSPLNQYAYTTKDSGSTIAEFRSDKQSFVQGGQNCDFCQANTSSAHPAEYMVDGMATWWQSPPLSRGTQYNRVNITIDLGQEFHVAYVWIQMANSPRPGSWILERSVDDGKTFIPWQLFAESPAECDRLFGRQSLKPIINDDSVICTHEFSGIHPIENAEMVVNLMENRPGRNNFSHSTVLQNFLSATHVRISLLRTKTLHGHLMDVNRRNDPTVTRRYFYAIKEIFMGGRCVCNGHADTCDILDVKRPKKLLCRCEHNTCGDQCEKCCPGFEQKQWQLSKEGDGFICEPCNCHSHSEECQYEPELDENKLSLDIHGKYQGGGRCLNCRDNTEGINCNKCVFGYYKSRGKQWNDTDVCQSCECDPAKHTGACEDETGRCECQDRFIGEYCDQCAPGYYGPPECKQCDCSVNGTIDDTCLPVDGQCPCKPNFMGTFCQNCAPGFTNLTQNCIECKCDLVGALHNECGETDGKCVCKPNFAGLMCTSCASGYYNHPQCQYCDCDASGTEEEVCNKNTGKCLCKPGFAGKKCDRCDVNFFGYPHCKECGCDIEGSRSQSCDSKTGDCNCHANFTSRTCERCAAGYYGFPSCKPCSCFATGSKGLTCDDEGQCYCKSNFQGKRCEICKMNFHNFPICEECNCNPNGVILSFAGCDKVAPGELCTCRENVAGRKCDQCKPTFWDLQYHHKEGCVECDCNPAGTISMLNTCGITDGQCACKGYVSGRRCDRCAAGFYNIEFHNQLGCKVCDCDIGGAFGTSCDIQTGQCRCRPRITGKKCNQTIDNHYFPTLWHNRYEAEDAITPENRPVRFAMDKAKFSNSSMMGFTVFSPIQDTIIFQIAVHKASLYRILFHFVNPTEIDISVAVTVTPIYTHTQDMEQTTKTIFPPTDSPKTTSTDANQPFVLNPGRWKIQIETKQRLFLDYIVLLPSEYYEGSLLKERVTKPCEALNRENSTCVDLLYPPLPISARNDAENDGKFIEIIDTENGEKVLPNVPLEILPTIIGTAAYVQADNRSRTVKVEIKAPETDDYVVVVEYHNNEEILLPVSVDINNDTEKLLDGVFGIHHCPYATFCRELVTLKGVPSIVHLEKDKPVNITLTILPTHQFGLAAINLIKATDWNNDYLKLVPVCIRKNGKCIDQWFPPAADAIVTEAESGHNVNYSISAENLPFFVSDAKVVEMVALDENQNAIEVVGVVPTSGHYKFIVQYFNPDSIPFLADITFKNKHPFNASLPLAYCPSATGCRALIHNKDQPDVTQFFVDDKYIVTINFNSSQKGSIYIDSITAVSYHSFSESLMTPQSIDMSAEFVKICGENYFENNPLNVTDYCRQKIFSLTSDFNMEALSCDCNPQGSTSFSCQSYGGQCRCRPNIIGRQCNRCAPGYYGFPDCYKCRCSDSQLCDERTGQCYCPLHIEGQNCDRCVPYAFGYDPLIGCQLCGCHPNGSEGSQLQCDPHSGQCLCKRNVGGRKCDKCLSGFYGFPHCYECTCDVRGTTREICNPTSAACKCKKNVIGHNCDTCSPGTFDLRASNPDGCSECFCFGATDRCRSSFLPITFRNFDGSAWTVTDENYIKNLDGVMKYESANETDVNDVYFLVPLIVGQDYTDSFGLKLSFIVSSEPNHKSSAMSSAADVQLVGNNMTVEYWANEQPVDPKIPFRVELQLLPETFLMPSGEAVKRSDFMLLLHDIQEIRLKGCYHSNCKSAQISDVQFEAAKDDQNAAEIALSASSVEICQCPPPYIGLSCQQCAPGYYRVSSGRYLGACVPCECHRHTGTCDVNTGICIDCQHDTIGDHCELCREGFYGDATTANPYSCLPCACPHPSPINNFALSCQVSETGLLESCECKPGYASERCDRCDVGFYGEPVRLGGSCEKCFCNDNNDLSVYGSCHPITGTCDLCQNNTDGRYCEHCKSWFYGDAVIAKNCTECTCNKCGSAWCDNGNGKCNCHSYVDGENCDRCVEDAWGFSSCHGCQPCMCGLAASNTQCNIETGHCLCMPGASGQRCDSCESGYWNYTAYGCQKCDCEADLSLGTVCDVKTGQCHCEYGATGPRCDHCLPEYLRIPTHGCRLCDECVHSLNRDVDTLEFSVTSFHSTIANISTAALVGARLNRIENKFHEVNASLDDYIDLSYKIGIENWNDDAESIKSMTKAMDIHVNRFLDSLKDAINKLDSVVNETEKLSSISNDHRELAVKSVENLKHLTESIGKDSDAVDRQKWTDHSRELVNQIKDLSDYDASKKKTMNEYAELEKLLEKLSERKNKSNIILDKLSHLEKMNDDAQQNLISYRQYLENVSDTVADIFQRDKKTPIMGVTTMISGIVKDSAKAKENFEAISNYNKEIYQSTNSHKNLSEIINDLLNELSESVNFTYGKPKNFKRVKKAVYEFDHKGKVELLEAEAKRLSDRFGGTRLDSKNGVDAANAYKEVLEALKIARKLSDEAIENADEARNDSDGQANAAKSDREKSATLLRSVGNVGHVLVNEIGGLKNTIDKKINEMAKNIKEQQDRVDSQRGKFDDEDIESKTNEAIKLSKEATEKIETVMKTTKEVEDNMLKFSDKASDFVKGNTISALSLNAAKDQVQKVSNIFKPVAQEVEKLRMAVMNTSSAIESCREKLGALKEKISLARDMANRIKLGAHFEKDSSLELPLPKRVTRSAAYTSIEFFFKTLLHNSLLFFFGNERGAAGTRAVPTDDYIAVETENGHLRVAIDLGASPVIIKSNAMVADENWRKVSIERVGKEVSLSIYHPKSSAVQETKNVTVPGTKSVLNLHQKKSRLFVGGIPSNINISPNVRSRKFVGDIDELRIHGEIIGLWNAKENGSRNIQGAARRPTTLASTSDEIAFSFDGDGFIVHKLGVWNPRKQSVFSLNFQTYSLDGLLVYIGKERDFIALEIQDGHMKLAFDFGSGVGKVISQRKNYNDGKMHSVHVHRLERDIKLRIDTDDVSDGKSPGSKSELNTDDVFYIGGAPTDVNTRFAVVPFKGCMERIQFGNEIASLRNSVAAKGVQNGCISKAVRVISLISERSTASFTNLSTADDIELTFRFKTKITTGILASILSDDMENILQVRLDNGFIYVDSGVDLRDTLQTELSSASDGQWHFIAITRTSRIRIDIDDLYSNEIYASVDYNEPISTESSIYFGSGLFSNMTFEGCIGDVTLNGKVFDFAKASIKEVQLTSCYLPDDIFATFSAIPDSQIDGMNHKSFNINEYHIQPTEQEAAKAKTILPTKSSLRGENDCMLPKKPLGKRDDSSGRQFGHSPVSRQEYMKPPESFDKKSVFSLQIRPTASNGIIILTTNERYTDHIGLYLVNGFLHFSYNSGTGQAMLRSNRSILDDEWHSIVAERIGIDGKLYIDGKLEAVGHSPHGSDAVDTKSPIYVGGIPTDIRSFASRFLQGIRFGFSGCLRDFKLNNKKFDDEPKEFNIVPCEHFTEDGVYIGSEGGYVILSQNLKVGPSFSVELEIRPRVKTAILLSVGDTEYLTLQLLNGTLKFSIDNGAGAETVYHIPTINNALCDGHWHHITLYKTKNLMTLTADGKSSLHIMKKGKKTETNTKDPFYLGGIPKGAKQAGLDTQDGYVGCIRVLNIGKKPRKKKNVSISKLPAYGDVVRNECPVN